MSLSLSCFICTMGPTMSLEPFGKDFRYRFRGFLEKRDSEDLDRTSVVYVLGGT